MSDSRKLRPIHPGEVLQKDFLEPMELSQSRLALAIGVHPRRWDRSPAARVRFELVVVDEGRRETVFSRTLHPTSRLEDRGWFEVDVSLAGYGERRVTFEFSTGTDREEAEEFLMGGWALPRIVQGATGGRVP